ncbi:MAG: dihydropteroate synthase [Gemmatimonadaceae bacterium]
MAATWQIRGGSIALDHPILVGVLNVTPDSFSDGGIFLTPDAARRHADQLVAEGADIIDIGGESTRPQGAQRVPEEQERARVVPVVDWLRREHPRIPISVDTTKSAVARAALDVGAHIINDVSGGRLDMHMCDVVAAARAGIIMMHSRGSVETMAKYDFALYGDDPVRDIMHELSASAMHAEEAGIPREGIVLDPGIGFAKRTEHSLAVLQRLDRFCSLGYPVMVGASRKRMVGELSGVQDPRLRLFGTLGAHVAALASGARLFRVHDVRPHKEALAVAWSIIAQDQRGQTPFEIGTR